MAKKEIHEMSYEELSLYKEQLTRELSVVNFYLQKGPRKSANGTKTETPHK